MKKITIIFLSFILICLDLINIEVSASENLIEKKNTVESIFNQNNFSHEDIHSYQEYDYISDILEQAISTKRGNLTTQEYLQYLLDIHEQVMSITIELQQSNSTFHSDEYLRRLRMLSIIFYYVDLNIFAARFGILIAPLQEDYTK